MQTVSFCELQYDTHTVSPFGYLISILQRLGVSEVSVRCWESGTKTPSMAEQIVPYIRLIGQTVFGAVEDLSDEPLTGGRTRKLTDGHFFQIDGRHPIAFPMSCRGRKCKKDGLCGQGGGKRRSPTLLPAKTMFFVLFARRMSVALSICV